jgi:hypothetical protein
MNKIIDMFSRNFYVHLALLLLLALAVYSNTFDVPFYYDDAVFIVTNPLIKDFDYFKDPSSAERINRSEVVKRFFSTRRVGYLTLWANYKIGGLNREGYHIVNLVIHMTNSILAYLIVMLTFKTPFLERSRLKGQSLTVALFAGALFAAHPLQTETVTYIVQRSVLLSAMFYLMSTAAYIGSRLSENRKRQYMLYALALVSALLGTRSKENFFTMPIMLALLEFMFFGDSPRKKILSLVPFLLTMTIIPLTYIKRNLDLSNLSSTMEAATTFEDSVPRYDYLLSQFSVVLSYIKLLLMPTGQSLIHSPEVHVSILEPPVIGSLLVLLAVFGFAVFMLVRSRSGDPACRLFSFGIFWLFLALSVESSILPIGILMTEYRVYLPGTGVFFALSTGAFLVLDRLDKTILRKSLIAMLIILPLVLAAATYSRNNLWTDKERMWLDVIEKYPETAEGYFSLGGLYALDRKYKDAIPYLETGLRLKSISIYNTVSHNEEANTHYNLGLAYHYTWNLPKAISHYESSLKLVPFKKSVHYGLATAFRDAGMKDKAIEHYLTAIRIDPNYSDARFNLALIYISQGKMNLARNQLEEILRRDQRDIRARQFLDYIEKEQSR